MHQSKLALSCLAVLASALAAGQSHAQTLTTLFSFDGTRGANPNGSLVVGGSTLYGTTQSGGTDNGGTVFSIPLSGGSATTLASLGLANGDYSRGGLTLVGSTLYGMTATGGVGDGDIFSIPTTGGTLTTLAVFDGYDGSNPLGSLTLVGSTFYGMTPLGGGSGGGVLFSIPISGGTPSIQEFFNSTTGFEPLGSLTLAGSTLYGLTQGGGVGSAGGTVFGFSTTGRGLTVLAQFDGTAGANPWGDVTLSRDGLTLYGTNPTGGPNGIGAIFSVPTAGGTPTALAFNPVVAGGQALGDLTLSADGSTLYGTTSNGGAFSDGTIFSISAAGGPITTLFSFDGTDGANPYGDLTLVGSTLYGTTIQGGDNNDGTVFALALATPEPSSVVLFSCGALSLGAMALGRKTGRRGA